MHFGLFYSFTSSRDSAQSIIFSCLRIPFTSSSAAPSLSPPLSLTLFLFHSLARSLASTPSLRRLRSFLFTSHSSSFRRFAGLAVGIVYDWILFDKWMLTWTNQKVYERTESNDARRAKKIPETRKNIAYRDVERQKGKEKVNELNRRLWLKCFDRWDDVLCCETTVTMCISILYFCNILYSTISILFYFCQQYSFQCGDLNCLWVNKKEKKKYIEKIK